MHDKELVVTVDARARTITLDVLGPDGRLERTECQALPRARGRPAARPQRGSSRDGESGDERDGDEPDESDGESGEGLGGMLPDRPPPPLPARLAICGYLGTEVEIDPPGAEAEAFAASDETPATPADGIPPPQRPLPSTPAPRPTPARPRARRRRARRRRRPRRRRRRLQRPPQRPTRPRARTRRRATAR